MKLQYTTFLHIITLKMQPMNNPDGLLELAINKKNMQSLVSLMRTSGTYAEMTFKSVFAGKNEHDYNSMQKWIILPVTRSLRQVIVISTDTTGAVISTCTAYFSNHDLDTLDSISKPETK